MITDLAGSDVPMRAYTDEEIESDADRFIDGIVACGEVGTMAARVREHWQAGREDTRATLRRRDWLAMPPEDPGIVVHDVHRDRE